MSFATPATQETPIITIESGPGRRFIDFAEIWRSRELLLFLVWRDIKVRYKQTVLGALWAVLQPLATMIVFSLFFGRFAKMPAGDVPYPLFAFTGLIPWMFFANSVNGAGQSVVAGQNLVTKVYFPRILIPMGTIGAGLADLTVSFSVLLAMMIGYYGILPGWGLLFVPFILLGLVMTAMGMGILLSALTVAYRDFRYVVPFSIQLWMFATPTIYMKAELVVSPRWLEILPLNPVYGLISNFRRAMLNEPLDLRSLALSLAIGFTVLIVGTIYFRRVERSFADII